MVTIKGALKKVYKALSGGTDTNAKSISGIIDDISTVASSGGGGGIFHIHVSRDPETGDDMFDKTFEQTLEAYNNGMVILCEFIGWGWSPSYDSYTYPSLRVVRESGEVIAFQFMTDFSVSGIPTYLVIE